jgi:hypothetical protein
LLIQALNYLYKAINTAQNIGWWLLELLQLLKGKNSFDLAKSALREKTKKLTDARNWLESKDKSLLFNHL